MEGLSCRMNFQGALVKIVLKLSYVGLLGRFVWKIYLGD